MILTDREWLRTVSFALFVGGVLGAINATALLLRVFAPAEAIIVAVVSIGVVTIAVHGTLRVLLDRVTDPPSGDTADERTEREPTDTTDT
jgi:hypothetical protein